MRQHCKRCCVVDLAHTLYFSHSKYLTLVLFLAHTLTLQIYCCLCQFYLHMYNCYFLVSDIMRDSIMPRLHMTRSTMMTYTSNFGWQWSKVRRGDYNADVAHIEDVKWWSSKSLRLAVFLAYTLPLYPFHQKKTLHLVINNCPTKTFKFSYGSTFYHINYITLLPDYSSSLLTTFVECYRPQVLFI
jgi:hypothetical protein